MINFVQIPVLFYSSEDTEEYVFKLKFIDSHSLDFLGNVIPSNSLLDILNHCDGSARKLGEKMPRHIPAGSVFCTESLGGSFMIAVSCDFDRMTFPSWIPDANYESSIFISAFLPMIFGQVLVYYKKSGHTPSAIPVSHTGCDKLGLPDGGALFYPNSYGREMIDLAWKTIGGGLNAHIYNTGLWLYAYGDIPNWNIHTLNPDYMDGIGIQPGSGALYAYTIDPKNDVIDYDFDLLGMLPQWDHSGDPPAPNVLGRVAWRYFYGSSKLYFQEYRYTGNYPGFYYPKKSPDSDDNPGIAPILTNLPLLSKLFENAAAPTPPSVANFPFPPLGEICTCMGDNIHCAGFESSNISVKVPSV